MGTFVRYFNPGEGGPIDALRTAAAEARADWDGRRPFISESSAAAGDRRLAALDAAIELLVEPVADPLMDGRA